MPWVEGRKVPSSKMGDGTLFDSEWIEGQTREPILLHPRERLWTLKAFV